MSEGSTRHMLLHPTLPEASTPLLRRLGEEIRSLRWRPSRQREVLGEFMVEAASSEMPREDLLTTQLFLEVIDDLLGQGWDLEIKDDRLSAFPPDTVGALGADRVEVKERMRAPLVAARDEQLREPATQRFVYDMERPRWHHGREVSVLDLFVAPQRMAKDIERRTSASEEIREELLDGAVDPYIQRATEDKDEHTGLRLMDVWRYCRYTWSLPLNNQPGRKMFYLVRDRTREFHPIIGIGALGSSVVQITSRDYLIGWTLKSLEQDPDGVRRFRSLETEVDRALKEIYWEDLLSEDEISAPKRDTLERLDRSTAGASPLNKVAAGGRAVAATMEDTLSSRYLRKRSKELHALLKAKMVFSAAEEVEDEGERLQWMLNREEGKRALGTALRAVKKRHVGSSIMDITTCGALPPYSDLLGGKLVALLMASPQVVADYQRRYEAAPSEIASRMKGEEVVRPAKLALLGTTSLYHVGSSQYNRLRAPLPGGELRYEKVGRTRGFGSVHLSKRTYRTLQELLKSHPGLGPESSAFAAGVNYKMRSIEAGLHHLGIGKLMKHENPRLVYLVPLASNWREYLSGVDTEPAYPFDVEDPELETRRLVQFWKDRWFKPRAMRPDTLLRLRGKRDTIRVSSHLPENDWAAPGQASLWQSPRGPVGGRSAGRLVETHERIPWTAFATLKDGRASFAERLSPEELGAIHVGTKLDDGLLQLVREGRRVYLTGNPGDGKTHIVKRYLSELEEIGAFVDLDASAESEDELLQNLERVIEEGLPAMVAVNEGPLRRVLRRLPAEERKELEDQLAEPYSYVEEEPKDYRAVVVNLGARRVLDRTLLDQILQMVQERVAYEGAPARVRKNRDMLARARVRDRLLDLLQLVAYGGAHVTMHEVLGFFSYIVTGGEKDVEQASEIAPYYDLCFAKATPFSAWFEGLDPASLAHPVVDMKLWESRNGSVEWLEPPEENPPEEAEDAQLAYDSFRSLKRRYYFEAQDGDKLLDMIPEDRKTFYALLRDSLEAKDTAKSNLLESMAYFFGGRDHEDSSAQIRVWTGLRYDATESPSAFVSSQVVPEDRVDLLVPKLREQVEHLLEYEPNHVRLEVLPRNGVGSPVTLDIDLDLWLAFARIRRGMPQRAHDPVMGRKLSQFMSRLAAAYQGSQGGFATIVVRDVELGETVPVRLSIERRRYDWRSSSTR